jgi:hypothetical protein
VVYFFAEHPDVLKKAREEILEALGPEGTPTVENMRGLKYRKSQAKFQPQTHSKRYFPQPAYTSSSGIK